ncbi:TPA: DNA mismatch repair endonuclease MutL [bacterium]|nr:DNA mismatch repair endonuclease MutL [bacterium]
MEGEFEELMIHRLDESTIVRIAAGEVIERPASVVKELVENSLDAGAKNISIRIERGGLGLIEISDDGIGMTEEELPIAIERHATSKIVSADDLENISTMGFRGEALSAISAAGHLTIVTKKKGSEGRMLKLSDSWKPNDKAGIEILPQGRAEGTTVILRNLFQKTPARLKFMKSETAEFSKISEIAERIALARNDVSIELFREGKKIFRTPGTGDLRATVSELFGADLAKELIEVSERGGDIIIEGAIAPQHISRKNRTGLYYNISGRPIADKSIVHAIVQAYEGIMPQGNFPIAFISIAIPPSDVDVNVHPAKAEVRFKDPSKIHRVIVQVLRSRLQRGISVKPISNDDFNLQASKIDRDSNAPYRNQVFSAIFDYETKRENLSTITPIKEISDERLSLRFIGEIAGRFILAEGFDGLYLIDQHAAHERVIFDKLMIQIQNEEIVSAPFLTPMLIEVTPSERAIAEDAVELFSEIGFEIEIWPDSIAIKSVPALFANLAKADEIIRSVIENLKEIGVGGNESELKAPYHKIAKLACKAAVKGTERMTAEEASKLISDLLSTTDPSACPHGRPTMIKLTIEELDKRFLRT